MTDKNELKILISAVEFAAEKHRSQRRKDVDASPYINHPIALANVLATKGNVTDLTVLCAAILHDTIEDTETNEDELRELFGDDITNVVLEVTDDKKLSKVQRKQLQIKNIAKASDKAKLVKLADKICNLNDILNYPPHDWSVERKREYFAWAEKVVNGALGKNEVLEKMFYELFSRQSEFDHN